MRFPCTGCNRPMRRNQREIFCNRCKLWTHTKCCGVSRVAYDRLSSEGEAVQWLCPRCLLSELPFAELDEAERDNHPCPTITSFLLFDQPESLSSQSCVLSPGSYTFAHLNTQSVTTKWEEISDFLANAPGPLILGLSPKLNTTSPIMEGHQLTQLITQPTRITANSITIIDHCYTSSSHSFSSAGFSPLAWSDLLRIFASRPCSNDKTPTPKFKEIRSFRKCNFENLFKHLANVPWGGGE